MNETANQSAVKLKRAFYQATALTLILWTIKLIEYLFNLSFIQYGIYPRTFHGIQGIFLAPLIHSSFEHIIANTGPMIILGTTLLYGYPKSAKRFLPAIYIGVGIMVWIFAREAYHIGASGVTFGMMFFVFTIGMLRRDKLAMVLSMIVLLLYGGMLGGLLSNNPNISFESHLAGGGLGFLLAFAFKNIDPKPPTKKYSWDDEEENGDNQVEILYDEQTPVDHKIKSTKNTLH